MRTQHGRARNLGSQIGRPAWMIGSIVSTTGLGCVLSRYVNTRAPKNNVVKTCGKLNVDKQPDCLKVNKWWSPNPECSGGVGRTYHASSCGKRFHW